MPQSTNSNLPGRIAGLTPFLVMDLMERALELEAQGRSVIHLEIGEPDPLAPSEVRRVAQQALEGERSRYTDSRGLGALRSARPSPSSAGAGCRSALVAAARRTFVAKPSPAPLHAPLQARACYFP